MIKKGEVIFHQHHLVNFHHHPHAYYPIACEWEHRRRDHPSTSCSCPRHVPQGNPEIFGFFTCPIAPITLLNSFAFILISLAQPSCTTPQEPWCRARPWWSSRCSSTWSASTPPARSCSACCNCPRPCRSCPSPPWWYNPCPRPSRRPPPAPPPEGQGHPPDARPSRAVVGALDKVDKVQPRPHHSDNWRCRWTLVMTVSKISAKYSATQPLKSENSVRPK